MMKLPNSTMAPNRMLRLASSLQRNRDPNRPKYLDDRDRARGTHSNWLGWQVERPVGKQVLPIDEVDIGQPINGWQYLALARAFRKWKRAKGYDSTMPIDAYDRFCKHVGIPHDECDGALHLPGYSIR